MADKITAIIHTLNEERNIERAIKSVSFADEILICDMYSDDRTVELAKKMGVHVIYHQRTNYVEPARNFAISKASNTWILILDADEEIPESLAKKLQNLVGSDYDLIEIPRKNIIFGKWMKASFWWPDNHPRFFKKGKVIWKNEIHSKPEVKGDSFILPPEENMALIHHHYESISQFIERLNRYTTIQAEELKEKGEKFRWQNLLRKPLGEFLGRFFAKRGYEDGVHGLALSLLQAFSFLVVYLKIWEFEKFEQKEISLKEIEKEGKESGEEIKYWISLSQLPKNPLKKLLQKAINKIR